MENLRFSSAVTSRIFTLSAGLRFFFFFFFGNVKVLSFERMCFFFDSTINLLIKILVDKKKKLFY